MSLSRSVGLSLRLRASLGLNALTFGAGLTFAFLRPGQILLGIHRQQRLDGDLSLLKNIVGARIADPLRLVAGERAEENEDNGHEEKAARQSEDEAERAIERAHPAV